MTRGQTGGERWLDLLWHHLVQIVAGGANRRKKKTVHHNIHVGVEPTMELGLHEPTLNRLANVRVVLENALAAPVPCILTC